MKVVEVKEELCAVESSTLIGRLRRWEAEKPDQVVYAFLADGEVEAGTLTFAQLDRKARAIAARLQELGLEGERALLLYPPGLEFIAALLGCFLAGVVAVPAYPPRRRRSDPRLLAIARDCRPAAVLTEKSVFGRARDSTLSTPADLPWIFTEEVDSELAASWREPWLEAETPAFLQYTSGSTGTPKGVIVTHGNLVHNEEMIGRAFRQSADTVVVGWLPLYHDMGLIGNVLQPLYQGARCVLMSPVAFLQKPVRWLEAISHYRATTSGGPNFAYDLCVRRTSAEDRRRLDLSSWRVAFNGSEPVRAETLERFVRAFGASGFHREAFYPCYGLAEATLFVAGGRAEAAPVVRSFDTGALERNEVRTAAEGHRALVSCGETWMDQRMAIVDPRTRRRASAGRVGEVWVGGASVAGGYWGRKEFTEETFRARIRGEASDGPYLRTGDLGFLHEGELFLTGRIKDLIIVRGRNLYPHDLELTAEGAHGSLRPGCGAAFAVDEAGQERVALVLEVEPRARPEVEEVAEAVRRAVAEEHEVQVGAVVLVKAGEVPRTSSGKVRRRACREAYLSGELETLGSSRLPEAGSEAGSGPEAVLTRDEVLALPAAERRPLVSSHLRRETGRVLGADVSRFEDDRPLTGLGLDSLRAMELAARLEDDLGVAPAVSGLLEGATLGDLVDEVLSSLESGPGEDRVAAVGETNGEHPASPGQQALWFLHGLAPRSSAYNIAAAARLAGPLDTAALSRSFERLVERHPALRTRFPDPRGEVVQEVRPEAAEGFELIEEDGAGWDDAKLRRRLTDEAGRPFDLRKGPLLRVLVLSRSAEENVLLLVVHHIVADFWSLAVLLDELDRTYPEECRPTGSREELEPLELRYSDFVRWQDERLRTAHGERLESFWRERLGGELPVLELPLDRPRPPVPGWRGAACHSRLGPELTGRLRALASAAGATLNMTLNAAFQALLCRYSGQTDLLVGTPSSGRPRPELAGLVGYFVNPLVIRGDLSGDPAFHALLGRIRGAVLEAFRHQDYPFELLVRRLQPEREVSRSPVFQVMFSMLQTRELGLDLAAFALGQSGGRLILGGLEWTSIELEVGAAAFDVTLSAAAVGDGVGLSLQYDRELFEAATAERMSRHFGELLESAVNEPERPLSTLSLLSPEERRQLAEWNATRREYPREACLHELVAAQVGRTPDAVAVGVSRDAEDRQLTYGGLGAAAGRLARRLRSLGVAPETPVAIAMERSPDMVVALVATLEAGGAYVPLDPTYPADRLTFMLEDAFRGQATRVLLTRRADRGRLPSLEGLGIRAVAVDDDARAAGPSAGPPRVRAENLAYEIYTSGSTGRPKGVRIPHRTVVGFLRSMRRAPGLAREDVLLAVTTLSFDIAVLEIFLPLTVGARVVLASREAAADGQRLGAELEAHGVTLVQATPATWRLLLEAGWPGKADLRILSGGEALPGSIASLLLERGAALWNMYGPTETTIWSAARRIEAAEDPVRVGGAIGNTQLHVVGRHLEPLPVGVAGEVLIGGEGLARGYLDRPALTAERFLPDPLADGAPGGRLYRVGDRVCRRGDGTLEFLGRIDHQVKVRGYRIELGEIEAALASHPAVSQAVAVVHAGPPGESRLSAFVVARDAAAPPADELRGFLRHSLPDYMVPAAFVALDELPLTPNGKVDRTALASRALPGARPETDGRRPRTRLEETLAELWCEVLKVDSVGVDDNFFDLGGHSLLAARLHRRLAERLERDDLTVVDLFQHPTVGSLARFLAPEEEPAPRKAAPPRPRGLGEVAVVGMAGRFPGAPDVEAFWRNLEAGVESITFFADGEMTDADPAEVEDPSYVRARGVLEGAEDFDAAFFGFTPREAEVMDPQHRLFLECCWEALEHAGYDPSRYPGRIGLFASAGMNSYLLHAGEQKLARLAGSYQAFISNDKDFVPTRTSYKLGLRGPSVNVQTACSSSLVAVHLACQSLALGDSEMALAGGVSVRVPQRQGYLYEAGGILSSDGHCRPFDADAGGTTLGNGLGVVVLKPLEQALADGDTVLAVIKGSAINNDGSLKMGYTAPSVEGQAEVLSAALAAAGVAPETISYVEAHGTGTALGDPIEVRALAQAFAPGGNGAGGNGAAGTCALGSVKSNIGHLDTAAGVAGLIKTVLALGRRRIPPSLNFSRPNPGIPFAGSPFHVNRELAEWRNENGTPRRAGVSSFGIGGTNAHVVLEEPPAAPAASAARPLQLLVLSAKTSSALDEATRRLAEHLESTEADLADVAYTLKVGRRPFEHRRWLVASGREDAAAALRSLDPERVRTGTAGKAGVPAGRPGALRGAGQRVVFLLSGQGSQHVEMGRRLYETEPVFRAEVDRGAKALEADLGLDLRSVIYPETDPEEAARKLRETRLTQPALFVVEHALARLWMAWGVAPAAMIGHSIGELTAAALAGVFSFEDALRLVAARGRLMQAQPPGAMLAVGLPEADVAPLLGPELSLAVINGPADAVVSGPEAAVEALEAELARGDAGVRCRRLHTSHAFHSAMMEPAVEPFVREVGKLRLKPPAIPFVSNVSGTWITDAEATDPHYWGRHLAEPVRFADGVAALAREPGTFLEVGPGHALATLARPQLRGHAVVASLPHPDRRDDEEHAVTNALGRLWQAGVEIDWESTCSSRGERRRRVPLPAYPFERRRFWVGGERKGGPTADRRDGLRKKADVGAWFYAPVWKQSFPVEATAAEEKETWLLLAAGDDLGARLAERLRSAQGPDLRLVNVLPGDGFARLDSGAFTVDPGRREHFTKVLEALEAPPDHVVHAWAAESPELLSAETGMAGLLALTQALAGIVGEPSVRLSVLTGRSQKVTPSDRVEPAGAALRGLLEVVPQELPRLSCRAIDVAADGEEEDLLAELAAELVAPVTDSAVAYRGGQRWVRSFEPVRLPAADRTRLSGQGAHLLTGGLGGVGLALARAIVENAPREEKGDGTGLVLLGRQALPPREEWDAWLEEHGADEESSRKIRGVRELEKAGAEVLVLAADVADREALGRAVAAARERFGAVRGVVHAAGVAGGGLLATRRAEDAAAVLRPKVAGVRALWEAVSEEPLDYFLLCSSINAVVGGFGQGDYCAANAHLDAFAANVARSRGPLVASLGWDRFRGVGMAAAGPGAAHSLLGAALSAASRRRIYRAFFAPETHWVLAEHRIAGRPTVPGATYLEMVRAAFAAEVAGRALEIREVVFLAPLAVDPGERREVLTVFDLADGEEAADFRVLSRAGEEGWQQHCRGRVSVAGEEPRPAVDVADVAARCRGRITAEDASVRASREFLRTGRRWQGLEEVRVGDGELLASIALPGDVAADLDELELHPALLDIAVGCVQLIREGDFLPLAYERLRIHGPLPRKLWSLLTLRGEAGDTLSCDALLADESGTPRVTVEGFSMRQVGASALAEIERAGSAEGPLPGPDAAARPEEAVLEGTIEAAEAAEVLRRVLSARRVPPHLVISPRDLGAVREAYRGFDPTRLDADLEGLDVPASRHSRPDLGTAYVAPGEGLEKVIAESWQRFLGIEEIGIHDNFFELGGTSLLGVQVVGELKKRLGREISTVSLFEAPTVAALARHLEPPAAGGEKAFEKTRSRAGKKKAALERTRRARGGRAGRKR